MSKSNNFSASFKIKSVIMFNSKLMNIRKELGDNLELECRICSTNLNEKIEDTDYMLNISIGTSKNDLKCDHVFHTICINNWLKCNNICPICGKENGGFVKLNYNNSNKEMYEGSVDDLAGAGGAL